MVGEPFESMLAHMHLFSWLSTTQGIIVASRRYSLPGKIIAVGVVISPQLL